MIRKLNYATGTWRRMFLYANTAFDHQQALNSSAFHSKSYNITRTTRESLKRSSFEDFCFEKKNGIFAIRMEMCHFFKMRVSFLGQEVFEERRFVRLWQPLKCGSVKNKEWTYKFRAFLGKDENNKQIFETTTWKPPQGLTAAKERKLAEAEVYCREQR